MNQKQEQEIKDTMKVLTTQEKLIFLKGYSLGGTHGIDTAYDRILKKEVE